MTTDEQIDDILACARLWMRDDEESEIPDQIEWEEAEELMRAAPALLAACKAVIAYDRTWVFGDPGDHGNNSYSEATDKVLLALAKAEPQL